MATISGQEYQMIMAERDELKAKLDNADSDFMELHYSRMLRVCEESYERATKANIVLERQEHRQRVREKREARKARQGV